MMLTKKGQAIRCPVHNIRSTNRGTKGVKLVNLAKGDKLVAISRVVRMQEDELEDGEENTDLDGEAPVETEIPADDVSGNLEAKAGEDMDTAHDIEGEEEEEPDGEEEPGDEEDAPEEKEGNDGDSESDSTVA